MPLIKKIFLLFLLSVSLSTLSNAQLKRKDAAEMLHKADSYILQKQYGDALELIDKLTAEFPNNELYKFRQAICYINIDDKEKEGLESILSLKKIEDYPDYNFYLGQAYYENYQFDKAKEKYRAYLIQVPKEDLQLKSYIQLLISYSNNAAELLQDTMRAKIINLEKPINTIDYEYTPAVTPDEKIMVFTYRGENSMGGKLNSRLKPDEKYGRYYEDVLISFRDFDGSWTEPQSIDSINTFSNEACVGISHTGDKMVVYKSSRSNYGDLHISYFADSTWTAPKKMEGDVNSPEWEGSATFTTDGKLVYFSSERLGGYGGKDLYVAEMMPDGKWGNTRNLGPVINSENDEDAPFIHPDGRTLYYSSNGSRSMGGYDVFYTEKDKKDDQWKSVHNAGYPINSLGDDRYYVLSADGQTGYFSRESNRGNKDHDIFIITPGKIGAPPVLALITGSLFVDGDVSDAKIIIRDAETGEIVGEFNSNPYSSTFTMILTPDRNYDISVLQNGEEVYKDKLDAKELTEFMRLEHDYHVYSDDYKGEQIVMHIELQNKFDKRVQEKRNANSISDSSIFSMQTFITDKDTFNLVDLDKIVKESKKEFYATNKAAAERDNVDGNTFDKDPRLASNYNPDLAKPSVYNPIYTARDTVYRIQVAAFRKPENFKWHGTQQYGDVKEVTYADGITRFTIGGTKYIDEAKILFKKLKDFGVTDAFIVGFKGDYRIPYYELVTARNKTKE